MSNIFKLHISGMRGLKFSTRSLEFFFSSDNDHVLEIVKLEMIFELEF